MPRKPVVSKHAAQGGKARASVLTQDERRAIARTAALARWGDREIDKQASQPPDRRRKSKENRQISDAPPAIPTALFPGKLNIADAQFSVYVLDDRKRVMAQREVVRALTGNVK